MMDRIYRNTNSTFHPFMREHPYADIKTFTQRTVGTGKAFDVSKTGAQPGAGQAPVAAIAAQVPRASGEKLEIAAAAVATREDIAQLFAIEMNK